MEEGGMNHSQGPDHHAMMMTSHDHGAMESHLHEAMVHNDNAHPGETNDKTREEKAKAPAASGHGGHAHMHGGGDLPMFANVTIAVCHCGAGCVLGDLIGEWIVYGSGAMISGRDIWPEWLIGTFSCVIPPGNR